MRSTAVLTFLITASVFMIVTADAVEEIRAAAYDVIPHWEERVSVMGAESGRPRPGEAGRPVAGGPAASDAAWTDYFRQMGVTWPEGSSVSYNRATGKLVVANTEENLERVRRIVSTTGLLVSQIEVTVHFVEFAVSDLGRVRVTQDDLMRLWEKGSGRVVAAPRALTKSGSEAIVKGVTEFVYPTEFTVHHDADTNTSRVVVGSVVEPSAFETREVGSILQVLPELSPEGNMVNVTLTPELVDPPLWRDYGSNYVDSNGKPQTARMEQPIFHTYTTSSSVAVAPGATVLIGGGMLTPDRQKAVYVFLTARLIGIRGEELGR